MRGIPFSTWYEFQFSTPFREPYYRHLRHHPKIVLLIHSLRVNDVQTCNLSTVLEPFVPECEKFISSEHKSTVSLSKIRLKIVGRDCCFRVWIFEDDCNTNGT